MSKTKLIAGLDIGTSSIKILIAGKKEGEDNLHVVYQAQEPSVGVRRGTVMEPEKTSTAIQVLLNKVKTEGGHKVRSVYINIGGTHLFCTVSKGNVIVSRADEKISKEDVERVLQSAEIFSLPSNKEILEVFPKEYIVDGQGGIKDVVGMKGVRLETEVLALGVFSPYKNNLTEAVLDADLQILDVIPSPLSSAAAVLSRRQKELGVALLEIGAGATQLAVFEEGNLIHLAILPIGSANITNDIAIGLKIDTDTAELIKTKLGCCVFKGKNKKEKIEIEDEEPLVFSQKMLSKIIEDRVSEIFGEVKKELKKISKQGLLPAGIVLTGGGAKLARIVDLAKRELKLPCRLGRPAKFTNLDDELSFTTACGLILRGVDWEEDKNLGRIKISSASGGFGQKLKKFFQTFIP